MKKRLHPQWIDWIGDEFKKPYLKSLFEFLDKETKNQKTIFPEPENIFQALNSTLPQHTRVVILGQDPYHGPGQAHGLSFSVLPGIKIPPSLKNIYKELNEDLDIHPASHGYLSSWAEQGVLLLNSVLTVEESQAASHAGKGWETFTDRIVHELNERKEHLVFFLWGSYAQKKGATINTDKHLVIHSPHPSPLSAYRGFFGSKPFSKTNTYLKKHNMPPIQWEIPETL
ncbi:MAG: uracil-DNA glycosylase [Oligoflexales bacterium]